MHKSKGAECVQRNQGNVKQAPAPRASPACLGIGSSGGDNGASFTFVFTTELCVQKHKQGEQSAW